MDYVKTLRCSTRLLTGFRIALTLLTVLFALSCKTVKTQRTTNNDILSVEESELSSVREYDESAVSDNKSIDLSVENEDITITTTLTTYSEPDSTGKQYVKSVEERKTEKKHRTGKNVTTENSTKQSASSVEKDDGKSKESVRDKSSEEVDTEEKTSTPAWVIALIVGIVAIVGIAVALIIKRYTR